MSNHNKDVMYGALQAAKEYIKAEGTNRKRTEKRLILKKIRSALAPNNHKYKERVRNLEALAKEVFTTVERLNQIQYEAGWSKLNKDLPDYLFHSIYSAIDELKKLAIKLKIQND